MTRADIEGDGVDEVLIEASLHADESLLGRAAGDYSVVLLRRLNGGEVETVLVRGDVVTEDEVQRRVLRRVPPGFTTPCHRRRRR